MVDMPLNQTKLNHIYLMCMENLALNNLQWLICHKTKSNHIYLVYIRYIGRMVRLFTNGCPRGVMVKAMNCGIVVREFVLQSRYYVHFRANTLGKGMNPLILPPAMGK